MTIREHGFYSSGELATRRRMSGRATSRAWSSIFSEPAALPTAGASSRAFSNIEPTEDLTAGTTYEVIDLHHPVTCGAPRLLSLHFSRL
jgi:hypothetical protein